MHRDVIPLSELDPRVRRLFVGFAFNALGSGLTMPFLYYYLAHVRDFAPQLVALVFAWMGLLGFLAAAPAGTLIDTYGPRRVMLVGLVVEAISVGAIGWVGEIWQGFLVATVMVLGTAGLWPANTAMLTRLVPESARERIYGLNFMILNAGLGTGGLVAALLIKPDSLASFQQLYVLDALTYLAYVAVIFSLPRGTGDHKPESREEDEEPPGWGLVLADRTLLWVVAMSVLALTFSYAQMETGFAAYAVDVVDLPASALGIAFGANTAVIVCGQFLALRLIAGKRRTSVLTAACLIWSCSWVIIAASALVSGWVSVLAITIGLGLFGFAETFWAPASPALVNSLAREELRGRYNALIGMSWTVSSILGPAVGGFLIGYDLAEVWVSCVVAGTAVAAIGFRLLRGSLSAAQDGLAAATTHQAPVTD